MKSKLIRAVIENKIKIPYICLNETHEYIGWTADFRFKLPNGENMKLDLNLDKDLFLLFVLASAWSKTGPWENATFFAGYLKYKAMDDYRLWCGKDEVTILINKIKYDVEAFVKLCQGINPRKKVSFRKDFYNSVSIIANEWDVIKNKLEQSEEKADYTIFINYISEIKGLGTGTNKMKIKIPLILRELRCQSKYSNIPGKLCCVPDARVIKAAKVFNIKLPSINSIKSIFKASNIIYENFGELYDIPLFAYEDLKEYV